MGETAGENDHVGRDAVSCLQRSGTPLGAAGLEDNCLLFVYTNLIFE
jgi:hypothetical protein